MDKQSENVRAGVKVPARLGLSRRKVGKGASAKPKPMSNNLRPRPSRGGPADSGVDSKEEDEDSRLRYRCVGVCGVIDSVENCSVGGKVCSIELPVKVEIHGKDMGNGCSTPLSAWVI